MCSIWNNADFAFLKPLTMAFSLTHLIVKQQIQEVIHTYTIYRVFSHDVTAAILVSQNLETAAMLVSQTSPVGVELLSYANAFFCSNKFA